MKFCSACGQPVRISVPEGDDRERAVCAACGIVHYENPRTVVGCLIESEGRVLLCRRAIEPARGRWTVPAGFLELGESLRAGAARETREEACAEVEILFPHAMVDLLHIGQVYVLFRARLASGADGRPAFAAGPESLDVELFEYDRIPFDELAFPVVRFALEAFLEDHSEGAPRFHQARLQWNGEGSRFDARNYLPHEVQRLPLVPHP